MHAPPAGSRAEAAGLARLMFSRLDLPTGARRLPAAPVPAALRQPALIGLAAAELDLHELFRLQQSVGAAESFLKAHVPAGMFRWSWSIATTSDPAGTQSEEVTYQATSVPAGVDLAQLVVTVAPSASGGSVLRADAEVIWYPRRSAGEYIDPARYHALSLTVWISGTRVRTIREVVTSRPGISRLAGVLNSSPVLPSRTLSCLLSVASYQLGFAVARHSRPAIVIRAQQAPCEGVQITVNGRQQPSLQNASSLTSAVNQLLGINPR